MNFRINLKYVYMYRSTHEILRFHPIPPFIFPLQSLPLSTIFFENGTKLLILLTFFVFILFHVVYFLHLHCRIKELETCPIHNATLKPRIYLIKKEGR